MKNFVLIPLLFAVVTASFQAVAEAQIATLRKGTPLDQQQADPDQLQPYSDRDVKQPRAYPMQPPVIPHKIENYQVDLNVNKCLSCHARSRTEESQAPMVSVTHFMDRDGNFLADVSPRRYFCNQCHVPQIERKPLLENQFKDVKAVLNEAD